ncbi:hypothetical protein AB3N61_07590 [Leptospira sp. WS58.C1]|uniref:hypothetical protein n=1 Tax=Leptospira TaxID=171 RepID=UPI0002BFD0C5|nr:MULTISPECIES: hypothetical protein [unclassified Leptospira]EMK02044.1 hypothetical protein LEP1GSC192_1409 [Leptospira sp. B5-022]MCR1793443.1 hypothetical protein [Leptospira sp. id769339]
MSGPSSLEETVRSYLETIPEGAQHLSEKEIANLLLEFSALLFEDPEDPSEKILVSDLSAFELDEFLNFYLEDMFPEDAKIREKGKVFLKKFKKFLEKRSLLKKEQEEEWKEFFKENEIR